MSVPEHLARHPTRAAVNRLSQFFGIRSVPGMQDWEIEVADPSRCTEFVSEYESLSISRFQSRNGMKQQQEIETHVEQGALADFLDVDRSTINRYQRVGMP